MPSGGGWTNAAAASQHAASDAKHAHASTHRPAANRAVNPLEQSGKTSDRDANERYDGPQPDQRNVSSPPNAMPLVQDESLLSLPAIDGSPTSTLDLLG